MVSPGHFINRVVYSTSKRPQIGRVDYQGKQRKAYIGFWGDMPVWKLAGDDSREYDYCAQKTMPIEQDPDYCGAEAAE